MNFKVEKLMQYTSPLFFAATLSACDINDDKTNTESNADEVITEDIAVLNYLRKDANYEGWGLHIWNDDPSCNGADDSAVTSWDSPIVASQTSDDGAVYHIPLKPDATCVAYIMHNADEKEVGGNREWDISSLGTNGYLVQGNAQLYDAPAALTIYEGLKGVFIDQNTVAWNTTNIDNIELHYISNGGFSINNQTAEVDSSSDHILPLTSSKMPESTDQRYQGYQAFTFDLPDDLTLTTLLQGQMVLVAKNNDQQVINATGIQLAPALDAFYADGDQGAKYETLGALVSGNAATFKLWAPTAKNVALYLYDQDLQQTATVPMTRTANGTWETEEVGDVLGQYYRYEVSVYHAALDSVEMLQVTDPYSLSLSVNSKYSQVVDLETTTLPPGWGEQNIPTVNNPEELVIYETHLRDLSSAPGDGGSEQLDGKYTAITETERFSTQQLTALAENGLNTIHLLNLFDIATVDEDPAARVELSDSVAKLCSLKDSAALCADDQGATIRERLEQADPTTGEAQEIMNDLRAIDSFNWGYDPFHYTTPEGSYATDAQGTVRIEEYRTLIMALHEMGFRVVMDVVYNHTNSAGTDDKSVLDKIVPGYYQRLNVSGEIETSTCCSNTATEHTMMGKLMTDSLVTWAEQYKIDGFRFDLMGHQPKQLMIDALAAVREVDSDTYFYGEGWNFGEVADDALFIQATQANMAGTEIGTFSDRLRDAVRGGGPFDEADQLRANQGFANAGVWNERQTDLDAAILKLRQDSDLIRLGMAGNLANFVLIDQDGETKRGKDIDYNGQQVGYTADPQENIAYISKHDNQTLWDNNMYKIASELTSDQRAQMQILALSTNMLGQGIPFFHMGSELLRSKSMQRDSYDSGDWFNTVNFDMSNNNWNVGLPRQDKDGSNWAMIAQIISDTNALPTAEDIAWTDARFKELLKIRTSSPLFSLTSEDEVSARVDFHNTGADSITGLIVMSIDDGSAAGSDLDPNIDAIVSVINATNQTQTIAVDGASNFILHSALVESSATFYEGEFTVPALTTAVFIQPQDGEQGTGLAVDNSDKDMSTIPPFGSTIPLIRGDMNGWGDTDAMQFDGSGLYSTTITLAAGSYGFKVADPTWGIINYGTSSSLELGSPLALDGDANITLTLDTDSLVTFSLDANDIDAVTLTVTAD